MSDRANHLERQYRLAAYIRSPAENPAPEDIDTRHLAVYRQLFFNNVKGFLDSAFPVCAELLGETRWQVLAQAFFAQHRSQTPYFLEISQEFLNFLENGAHLTQLPDYLYELAHYEWLELAVDIAADCRAEIDCDMDTNVDLSQTVPVLAEATQGFMYQYPVHQISLRNPDPQPKPTALIVFRDRHDQVRFLETNLMTLQLLTVLLESRLSGGEAVKQLLQMNQMQVTAAAVQGGLSILNEWHAQGLILGGKPCL